MRTRIRRAPAAVAALLLVVLCGAVGASGCASDKAPRNAEPGDPVLADRADRADADLAAKALPPARASDAERAASAYYERLLAGDQPDLAGLTQFMTLMPKGGDLHHHYSGSIYAESYLDWAVALNCRIDTTTWAILPPTPPGAAPAPGTVPASDVMMQNDLYRKALMAWSDKDFANHFHESVPPDMQFFGTFGLFGSVSGKDYEAGLAQIKQRALDENVSYIETMLTSPPNVPDAALDAKLGALTPPFGAGTPSVSRQTPAQGERQAAALREALAALDANAAFQESITKYVDRFSAIGERFDDERFTLRFQTYAVRGLAPSVVFSALYAGFKACDAGRGFVGVNIVGPENGTVAMNSYGLHMEMFRVLRERFPGVRLSLHAGELALGMVPPEGLRFHIRDAVEIADAQRIGHGVDIAHESGSTGLLALLRERGVTVEINLTSNEFILGIRDRAHPISLYRAAGVPFVISTDDAGVSRNSLSSEYVLFASRYRPSYAEVKAAVRRSIERSFLADTDKARLLADLAARFAAFEAKIAGAR